MKTTNRLALLATIFSAVSFAACAAEDTGIIKDKRVNVRGQAKLNSEVVTQMKKDEPVTILEEIPVAKPKKGEPAKWYKIRLPSNTPVWVNTQFIDAAAKTVKPAKLNVRSGPGEQFSVIAQLEKGAAVKEIRIVGDWMEIEAPAGAFAYVAADLVSRAETAPVVAESKPAVAVPAPAPVPIETVKVETTPAPVVAAPVPTPAPVPPPAPAPKPTAVAAQRAVAEPQPAPAPTATTQPEKKSFWSFLKKDASKKSDAKPTKAVSAKKTDSTPVVETEPLAPRVVTREGVVHRSYNLQAPTFYELKSLDSGKLINYLSSTSTNLPWKAIVGRSVIITGEEAVDKRWPNTPVLKIETLKTTP
jgi:uncharacterized protein YgiM (DUF1202 family)